LKRFLKLW